MPDTIARRVQRLRGLLARKGIDALLVSQPENRRYLSGFTGSSGWLLITQERQLIASDFRYYEQIAQQCPDYELHRITTSFGETLSGMVEAASVRRLGFEANAVTVGELGRWRESTGADARWFATYDLVEMLRVQKDAEELAAIERALQTTDGAMAHVLSLLRPGMTEKEAAWRIQEYMMTHGAEGLSFDSIVAGGPRSAMPHARPTDEPLKAGQPVVIDIGAKVDGYCGDLTRTVMLGEPPDGFFMQIYNTVLDAQTAAKQGIRADMPGSAAHALAQDVIDRAGYGANFGHGLGHGLGLAIHEKPRAGRTSTDTLPVGSVVTVEPGIYLPEWGGVRIEDVVVVEASGNRTLTGAPKTPILPIR